MTKRLWLLVGTLACAGCQCFVPVVECKGIRCDGGFKVDAGADAGVDAGADAGVTDAGTGCVRYDGGGGIGTCAAITGYVASATECRGECVLYPITTAGIFPNLPACIGCGCDPLKFNAQGMASKISSAASFCDQVFALTTSPPRLIEAFGDFDGGCTAVGALNYECLIWQRDAGMSSLGPLGFARACQATLVPQVVNVQCRVQ